MQAMLDSDTLSNEERALRIRAAIASGKRTKAEIAELLNVSPQAITGWETTGRIGKASLSGLALLTGHPIEHFLHTKPASEEADWPPVMGYSQAVGLGRGMEAQEYAETHKLKFRADALAGQGLNPEKLAVMYGEGDSMLPRIHSGDAILFDTSDTRPRDGSLFVIQVHGIAGREYQVKRAMLLDDVLYFSADNPAGDHSWKKPRRADAKRGHIEIIGRGALDWQLGKLGERVGEDDEMQSMRL